MSVTIFPLPIDTEHFLFSHPRDGGMVKFNANTTYLQPDRNATLDESSLNLISIHGDVLLSIAFHRRDQIVVLKSIPANGEPSEGESFSFAGFFTEGASSNVSVGLRGKEYLIFMQGILRHTYTRRIDADIAKVSYVKEGDMTTAIFGSTIDAKIVNSLPPPDPRQCFLLSVGNRKTLNYPVAKNEFIYLNSSTTSLAPAPPPIIDSTWINLLSASGTIPLSISFSRNENAVTFRALRDNEEIMPEKPMSFEGLFRDGKPTSVVVFNGTSAFDIYIDGTFHHEFTKRFLYDEVTAVEYGKNVGMDTQIFADTINVATAYT